MNSLSYTLTKAEVFRGLNKLFSHFGSLNAPAFLEDLVNALKGYGDILAPAVRLAEGAVPEEGDPHPQRANVTPFHSGVILTTPGGVDLHLYPGPRDEEVQVILHFNRDSTHLASLILADMCLFNGWGEPGPQTIVHADAREVTARAALIHVLVQQENEDMIRVLEQSRNSQARWMKTEPAATENPISALVE